MINTLYSCKLEALHCKETLQKSKKEIEEMTFFKKSQISFLSFGKGSASIGTKCLGF